MLTASAHMDARSDVHLTGTLFAPGSHADHISLPGVIGSARTHQRPAHGGASGVSSGVPHTQATVARDHTHADADAGTGAGAGGEMPMQRDAAVGLAWEHQHGYTCIVRAV